MPRNRFRPVALLGAVVAVTALAACSTGETAPGASEEAADVLTVNVSPAEVVATDVLSTSGCGGCTPVMLVAGTTFSTVKLTWPVASVVSLSFLQPLKISGAASPKSAEKVRFFMRENVEIKYCRNHQLVAPIRCLASHAPAPESSAITQAKLAARTE